MRRVVTLAFLLICVGCKSMTSAPPKPDIIGAPANAQPGTTTNYRGGSG